MLNIKEADILSVQHAKYGKRGQIIQLPTARAFTEEDNDNPVETTALVLPAGAYAITSVRVVGHVHLHNTPDCWEIHNTEPDAGIYFTLHGPTMFDLELIVSDEEEVLADFLECLDHDHGGDEAETPDPEVDAKFNEIVSGQNAA
jgi:hypothetical protein